LRSPARPATSRSIHPPRAPAVRGGGLLVLAFALLPAALSCGGVKVPPDFVDLVACLAACGDRCERVEGGYICKPGSDPCAECPPGWECVDRECVVPEPPPEPPEPPAPPDEPDEPEPPPDEPAWPPRCPKGTPQAAGPKEHGGVDCFDATPRVCGPDFYPIGANGESCGLEGRRCIPVGCEGADNGLARTYCEEQLMGGTEPEWHVSGAGLYLVDKGWGACVRGQGVGEVWWCFPGHPTVCSKHLQVSR